MTCPALESADVSTQRCREAVAALRTCVRLSGTSHGGAERDDCSFGAAICAAQTSHHVEAAHFFSAAAQVGQRRGSPRWVLSLMGAFINYAKAVSWREVYALRRERLIRVLAGEYLSDLDDGRIPGNKGAN